MLQFSLGRELIRPLTSSISSRRRRRRRRLMETRTARRRLSLSATPLTLPTTQKGGGVGVSAAAAATLDRPPREASLEQTCTHHWDTFPEMEKGETREGRREKKKKKQYLYPYPPIYPYRCALTVVPEKKLLTYLYTLVLYQLSPYIFARH